MNPCEYLANPKKAYIWYLVMSQGLFCTASIFFFSFFFPLGLQQAPADAVAQVCHLGQPQMTFPGVGNQPSLLQDRCEAVQVIGPGSLW